MGIQISETFFYKRGTGCIPSPCVKRQDPWAVSSSLKKAALNEQDVFPEPRCFGVKFKCWPEDDKVTFSWTFPSETLWNASWEKNLFFFLLSRGSWLQRWVIRPDVHVSFSVLSALALQSSASVVTDSCIFPVHGRIRQCWVWKDTWKNTVHVFDRCYLSIDMSMFAYFTRHLPLVVTREMKWLELCRTHVNYFKFYVLNI